MTNQCFPIIYRNERFIVDPSLLYKNSRRFQELIKSNDQNLNTLCLKFSHNNISSRNLDNFLKICQNLPADVQDSEMKEICLLALIFKSDHIYKTALDFIKNNINSNFSISEDEYEEKDGNHFFILEKIEKDTPNHQYMNNEELDTEIEEIPSHPVCYQIIENIPFAKLTRFYFMKDGSILYTAKYKKNHFYIGSGDCFHIHEKRVENCAQIICDKDNYNKVVTEDQEFAICFVGYSGGYSIDVSFENNGEKFHWEPKEVKEDSEFDGEYKHSPIHTDRNIILQDSKMKNCLIIRKMSKEVIEAECNPDVNPIIIFAIALSQIIGPFSSGHNFHKSFVN